MNGAPRVCTRETIPSILFDEATESAEWAFGFDGFLRARATGRPNGTNWGEGAEGTWD